MAEGSYDVICQGIIEAWEMARSNWHYPQLPRPIMGRTIDCQFFFENYRIALGQDIIGRGSTYMENLFEHLIVHYIFCPRSLETAAQLSLAAIKALKNHILSAKMVNIFSDIVVDSFRLERSGADQQKVLEGWKWLGEQDLSETDKIILGFLAEYWGVPLPRIDRPEVEMLLQVFSPGIRDKVLWSRQCQQLARILEPLEPGILGLGQVCFVEILNGSADSAPIGGLASNLEPMLYEKALSALGLCGDLKRWYRDQSYNIEIRPVSNTKESWYPCSLSKWRLTDPLPELDISYSLSLSPKLLPGLTTYQRGEECCQMAELGSRIPDLLVVLDSSRSMEGHSLNTKSQKATLAAFKACHYAHSRGAEVAAINFSDRFQIQPWTRHLGAVEDVLVEYLCGRTYVPGKAILEMAQRKKGCLILCITDTHIQNLYLEWNNLKRASEFGDFVLFCIDQSSRDKQVEEALASLGKVYYINKLDDLLMLVVDVTEQAYRPGTDLPIN